MASRAGLLRFIDRTRVRSLGPAAELLILRADGGAVRFKEPAVIRTGWAPDPDDPHTIRVMRTDAEFEEVVRSATHIVIRGSTNETVNDALHEVSWETTDPAGLLFFWKLRFRPTGKRYTPQ